MIEENVIQSPNNETPQGTFSELTFRLKLKQFLRGQNTYDRDQKNGLFALQPRAKKSSSQAVQCGIQKGFTVGYLSGLNRLCTEQQGFSFKVSTAYTVIYAQNTERNNQSSKELITSVRRSYKRGVEKATIRNNDSYENNKSGALRIDEKRYKIGLRLYLKIDSFKTVGIGHNVAFESSHYEPLNYEIIALICEIIKQRFTALNGCVNLTHKLTSHTDQHTQ